MTDVETQLRTGLNALAEDVRPRLPNVWEVGAVKTPRRHRRLAMASAVVATLFLATTAAAATGIAPRPVRAVLDEITGWNWLSGAVDPDTATQVASTTLDGTTYEFWSTGPDVPRCEYVRVVTDGQPENGSTHCTDGIAGGFVFGDSDLYMLLEAGSTPGQMNMAGHAPMGSVSVELTYVDSTTWRVPVQDNGFFVAALSARHDFPPWRSFVAYDVNGAVLERIDI